MAKPDEIKVDPPKMLTIDQAVEALQNYYDHEAKEKPVVVNVFGLGQGVGKTYFCKQVAKQAGKDIMVYTSRDPRHDGVIQQSYADIGYLLFEVEVNTPDLATVDIGIQNRLIQPFTQKPADINVLIYNPDKHDPSIETLESFDIIVTNWVN